MTNQPKNGAQNLITTLVQNGVEVCFSNPGTSEMHFVAALDQTEGMRAVLGLFEGVCTGAADGYARMTGNPACTLLHCGPGMANGIANLHNAWRANTPMVNIVGDHASFHLQHDAPLTTDIESLAKPFSIWYRSSSSADDVSLDTAQAIQAARSHNGIATLVLPGDTAWTETEAAISTARTPLEKGFNTEAVIQTAEILREDKPTLLLMSGKAVLDEGLHLASRIAKATNANLMSNRPTARRQIGEGRPVVDVLAYPIPTALKQLENFANIILIGTEEPVGFFGYPNLPSRLAPRDCDIFQMASADDDVVAALAALADELNAPDELGDCYRVNKVGLPVGELDKEKIWRSLAAQLPENAIMVNEALTSFTSEAWPLLTNNVRSDMLQGTGGAIGHGLAQTIGAAVACPNRRVIGLQADGSAMYTIQALWTHARENLDITTILFNNRAYKILQGELVNVGAVAEGKKADSLLHLDNPTLNFVEIAQGMGVEASRAHTAEEFNNQLAASFAKSGPHLIEVHI